MKETRSSLAAAVLVALALLAPGPVSGQEAAAAGPPPSTGGFYPLSEVHRGLQATAWTVFSGTKPEPMQVEILGVLRGGRGPGHDMILAQLHGAKPEYTGVVAGMSGSPVYVGNKLLGSISYRIGQFSKDPIAGITPIEQMLEVRDLPLSRDRDAMDRAQLAPVAAAGVSSPSATQFQAMETPLVMSGFAPEAIRLWQDKMKGTGLDVVAAGGGSGSSLKDSAKFSPTAAAAIVPGSAVSMQLVRGDLDIAATCTVTYVDPKRLLACGHPVLQAGPESVPMTSTDVIATLASPLEAFKIINTGETIGAFTQDRDSAISGVFGAQARMIPIHLSVHGDGKPRHLDFEMVDLPAITPQIVLIGIYQCLLQSNQTTIDTSYHLKGKIDMEDYPSAPLDVWASGGDGLPSSLQAAMQTFERFMRIYNNDARQGTIRGLNLDIEAIPRRVAVVLESARVISSNIVHAGDTVTVEATIQPWHQPERNVRVPVTLPARLQAGTLRVLVSDGATLDRTMDQPKFVPHQPDMDSALAQAGSAHAADRVYVSLLVPETQAGMEGRTLTGLPVSMSNALEPLRSGPDVTLNGESAVVAADAPADGVLSGFTVLNLRIEPGGGIH
ncbi:SpoIVB peptidase S55 [Acidobacteria bacterium AB60]|nr:SpoIVB peptidase S55 [Acidobacteria bacterium AB60]